MNAKKKFKRCLYCHEPVPEEEMQRHTVECKAVGIVLGISSDLSDDNEATPDHPDTAILGIPLFS